jgi:hypothetical protein
MPDPQGRASRERALLVDKLWKRVALLERLADASRRDDAGTALEDAAVALFRAATKIREIETIVRLQASARRSGESARE